RYAVDGDGLSRLRRQVDLVAVAVDSAGQAKTGSDRIEVKERAVVVELQLPVVGDAFLVQIARIVAGVRRDSNPEQRRDAGSGAHTISERADLRGDADRE